MVGGLLLLPFAANAQDIWRGAYNRLGLKAGANNFNIDTDQLPISSSTSWTAGFTTRSSFYDDFQLIYGLQFYDFKAKVTGREKIDFSSGYEEMDYNMIGVQGSFLLSYKILDHHLSVEAGPVLQVNGKFDPAQNRELWYVGDTKLQAGNISKVSAFNVNFAVGISGGFERLKFWAQYQYGINNMLNRLNGEDLQEIDSSVPEFDGHMTMISGGIVMFL